MTVQNENKEVNQKNQVQQNNQIPNQNGFQQNSQISNQNGFQQNSQIPNQYGFQQNNLTQNNNLQYNSSIAGGEALFKYQEKRKKDLLDRKKFFQRLAAPSLIYALVFTICMYKNISGIAIIVWIAATIAYLYRIMKVSGLEKRKNSALLTIVMCLLGISTFLTGSGFVIFFNYVAFFLLLAIFILYQVSDITRWGIGKFFLELIYMMCGAIENIFSPFMDASAWLHKDDQESEKKVGRQILLGLLISVPCVVILASCLASADAVFGNFLKKAFLEISLPNIIYIGVLFVFGFFSSYCGVRFCFGKYKESKTSTIKKIEPTVAITFTTVILLLYLCFCLIQIVYLFGRYGELPEHMTYSSYARTGFFQLLFVCILNLILVLAVKKYFRENKALNGILLGICGCSYIMTASSVYRMLLYISVYQLTFLRVLVLTVLGVIAILLALVIIHVIKPDFLILRACFAVVCVVYLAFSFAHVDYFIAAYDLAHIDALEKPGSERGDTSVLYYISNLSTDAAPAIMDYLNENPQMKEDIGHGLSFYKKNGYFGGVDNYEDISWYTNYIENNKHGLENHGIRTFNVSHKIAQNVLLYPDK